MNEKEEMATEMEDLRVSLEEVRKAAESKEVVVKDHENERVSLKDRVKEKDHRLEILTKELEKIRALETHLREGEMKRKKAADALMGKEVEVGRLVRELDEIKSQLKETLEEKKVLEELSEKNDTKLREENEAMKKKLDVEMQSLDLKEKEIESLEKTVGDLRSRLEAAEADHKGLIEKFESSGPGNPKGVPAQEAVGKLPWPLAAAASTGTLANAAFMAYLKYSKQSLAWKAKQLSQVMARDTPPRTLLSGYGLTNSKN